MLAKVLNKLWLLSLKKDARAFAQSFSKSEEIQFNILLDNITRNANTAYGLKYNFSTINSYEEFISQVPIVNEYKSILAYTNLIEEGKSNILYSEETVFFEETSGSSSASKLIPYTPSLKKEFNMAFAPWIHSLYKQFPGVFNGKAYWSISPPLKEKRVSSAGIKIGIEDDTEYLNGIVRYLYKYVNAVDISKMEYQDGESFFIETWKQLLKVNHLSFISIWSPSFLLQLYNVLERNYEKLKTSRLPDSFSELNLAILFPHCKVISCWTDASASLFLNKLKKIAGGIPIHAKGLLMTEGVISTPYLDNNYLAYRSHFYEFVGIEGKCFRSHELKLNYEYTVLITTGAGLYRYNTNDIVKVISIIDTVPSLQFIGRGNQTSDMVGEKVSEGQLLEVVKELKEKDLIEFMFVFPILEGNAAYYKIVVHSDLENKEGLKDLIKSKLRENPYYDQAIKIGQLSDEEFEFKKKGYSEQVLIDYAERKEMKIGDVKLGVLVV